MKIEDEGVIRVGAIAPLVVPSEDVGGDYDDGGEDLDTAVGTPTIQRPPRDAWVTLLITAMLPCKLLPRRKDGKSYAMDYYHVAPALRRDIPGEVRPFVVVPYFNWTAKRVDLLVTPAAEPGASGWGDTMLALLKKPVEWHAQRQVRIRSNREAGRYDIRFRPVTGEPSWPTEDTGTLLGAAMGPDKFITTADHPVYRSLLDGEVLS